MKKCPFCAEEIQDEAIKCRHCNEFLDRKIKPKKAWYFKTGFLFFMILSVGPLALPLLWLNPHYTKMWKVVYTIIILAIGYFLSQILWESCRSIYDYYNLLNTF